jgi:hypothetical protein
MGSEKFMMDDVKVIGTSESWMYLSNTKSFAYEVFENWINFFLYYLPVVMVLSYFVSNVAALRGIALFFPVILIMFIRRKVNNLWKYIGSNLLVIAAVFIISPAGVERVLFTLVVAIYFIYSFKMRYDEAVKFLNFSGLLLSGVLLTVYYLAASYIKVDFAKEFVVVVSFNTAVCYAIYLHLTKTQKLLEWETSYAATFMNRVKKMKLFTVTLIVAAVGILNLLLWKSGMYALFDYFQDSIANFFHSTGQPMDKPKLPKMLTDSDGNSADGLKGLGEAGEPSLFLTVIMKIIELALTVMVIVIFAYVFWLIYLRLKEIYRYLYYREVKTSEKRELILPTENIGATVVNKIRNVRESVEEAFEKSNRKKIRKLYNKMISKHKNKGIKLSIANTPLEMQQKIHENTKQNLEEVTRIYEKARYSTKECSDEDVNKFKKFV